MLYLAPKVSPHVSVFAVFAGLVILLAGALPGEGGAPPGLDRLKETYGKTQREMQKQEEALRGLAEKEHQALDSLNEIDLSIDRIRKEIVSSEKAIQALESEMSAVLTRLEKVQSSVEGRRAHAAKRMVGLYKLYNLGRMNLIASAESLVDFLWRRKALERVLESDRRMLEDYRLRREELAELSAQLARRRQERAAAEEAHRRQIGEMEGKRGEREALLVEVRGQKAMRQAALASLKERAAALDGEIQSFRTESPEEGAPPDEISAPGGFRRLKGLLNMPVKGKITTSFGRHRNPAHSVMNFQTGINIQADRGEPIRSVYGGRVIFSDWFKGYGNMLIIDHADHYYTLYAHAEELFKQKGDVVQAEEVIGTVGDSGAMGGPALHFEVRHHGKPVDPMAWLKKGGSGRHRQ